LGGGLVYEEEDGHAHGQVVGDLLEDDAVGSVGDCRNRQPYFS